MGPIGLELDYVLMLCNDLLYQYGSKYLLQFENIKTGLNTLVTLIIII